MTCHQCLSAEAESTVWCQDGSACVCSRCAADFWAFWVSGEGFEDEAA